MFRCLRINNASRILPVFTQQSQITIPHQYEMMRLYSVKRLFVGNLPWTISEEALRDKFAPYGELENVKLISDRDTGRPRGFAFVDLAEEGANNAIRELNGTNFMGRILRVNEAERRSFFPSDSPPPE